MIDLFCIASGPSLTLEDCKLIENSGIKTVAVNNTWEAAKFCTYLYAGDAKWWNEYHDKITISAERWTCNNNAAMVYKLNYHIAGGPYNSGMRAIQFGIMKGFKNIALIGYDCSIKNGMHWHGAHTGGRLGNPDSTKIIKWHEHFKKVKITADKLGVKIINCSRYTELECFDCDTLENVLMVA